MKNIVKIFTIALVFCLIFVLIGGGLTVIPTYALSDVDNDLISITDLTNTMWTLPEMWSCPAGLYIGVGTTVTVEYSGSTLTDIGFAVGYFKGEGYMSQASSIVVGYTTIESNTSFKITFLEMGPDSQTKLINWLLTNAVFNGYYSNSIYSVGDILYFNETLDLESLDLSLADTYEELSVFKIGQYNFSYHTLDDTSYTQFRVGKSPDTNNVMYPPTAVYDNNGWINQRYRVIVLDSVPSSNIETWLSENSQVIDENQLDFAYNYGYTTGFDDGFNSGVNSDFASDLLGNTLATPFNALDSIVLFEVGGVAVSVLTILYSLIGFSLFIGILKMVAGG